LIYKIFNYKTNGISGENIFCPELAIYN